MQAGMGLIFPKHARTGLFKSSSLSNWVPHVTTLPTALPMQPIRIQSVVEQTAANLRTGLREGRWSGRLPGVVRLAAECDVSTRVVRAALRQLEKEGLLAARGHGRSRTVAAPSGAGVSRRALRVGVFLYAREDRHMGYMAELQHALETAGHVTFFAQKSQIDLNFAIRRVKSQVSQTPADAWVVCAGSREVLEWFATQPVPVIALFGRASRVPIASSGPDKVPAYAEATRQLIRLGHRRILLLCLKLRRLPVPGPIERAFLAELAAHGCPVSGFNLPDWEETIEGFHVLLAALFRTTPPTALIIDTVPLFIAAQQFLAGRNLLVPKHVSLVSTDADPAFEWCHPAISHIRWDSQPVIRRIVRWATAVSHGRPDLKHALFPAEFVTGGTIGPVWNG